MTEQEIKRCYNCKFFATTDSGYSNWTVIETYAHCMKNHFESKECSYEWQHENPKDNSDLLKMAENCPDYKRCKEGTQVSLDVDGEVTIEDFKEDSEIYEAAKTHFNTNPQSPKS